MVIGNGLLAKKFSDYIFNDDVVIFASGVSDSKLMDEAAYQRELELLKQTIQQHADKLLVYFSTCSVFDQSLVETSYIKHKLFLENMIEKTHTRFLIFRISNVVGHGGNPKTIINYLVNAVRHGHHFQLWKNAYRNIIDLDDAYVLMDYLIRKFDQSFIINIANPVSYSTMQIVSAIELFTGKKANYTLVERGTQFDIDTSLVEAASKTLGIYFPGNYLFSILTKYYNK